MLYISYKYVFDINFSLLQNMYTILSHGHKMLLLNYNYLHFYVNLNDNKGHRLYFVSAGCILNQIKLSI